MNLVGSWRPNNKRDLRPLVHLDLSGTPEAATVARVVQKGHFSREGYPQLMTPSR